MEKIVAIVSNKKVGASTTMADPTWVEAIFDSQSEDDLSSWEIINPSDDEGSDDYSFDEKEEQEEEDDTYVLDSVSSEQEDLIYHQDIVYTDVGAVEVVSIGEQSGYDAYSDCNEEEEDETCDDDDDDYDDELVPRSLSDRFGKQRLMKLGKRACNPKFNNPKKLPCYFYKRPGGVHSANCVAWKRKIVRKKEA